MIALALLVCAMLAALALSSFCSGTETGLSSVSLGRIRHMAREGSAAAKIIADRDAKRVPAKRGSQEHASAFRSERDRQGGSAGSKRYRGLH